MAALPGWAGGRVRFTGVAEGDLSPPEVPDDELTRRRRQIVDLPWAWVRQEHGAGVVVVDGDLPDGPPADALVTRRAGVVLAVHTADCAPVALVSPEGVVAAVHAGWRGVEAGVLERAVAAMRALGASRVWGRIGPCIEAACYEFTGPELDVLVERLGAGVRARTTSGTPALDLPAAVRIALARTGVVDVSVDGRCTACRAGELWSHRARGDRARQALAVWRWPAR